MIPQTTVENYSIVRYPSKTYYFDIDNKRIVGFTDSKEAMKQAIYKMLLTERRTYVIYDSNYGTEIKNLIGKDVYLACAMLERYITGSLSVDDRIKSVTDFDFSVNRNTVTVSFTANTIYGDTELEVSYDV